MNPPHLNLTGLPQHTFVALPPFARLRFQLPLVAGLCALLPGLIVEGLDIWQAIPLRASSNAFYAALASSLTGLMFFRRLGSFPGITSFGQVGAAVVAPYTCAVLVILASRLDYSRPILFTSAALSAAVFYALWLYCRRSCAPAIYAVPGTTFALEFGELRQAELRTPPQLLERNPIVVANLHADLTAEWQNYLLQAALSGVPVYHEKQLQESISGRVDVQHLSENSFGSLNPNQLYLRAKRAFDVLIVVTAAPWLMPLLLLTALLIKLDSPGPVLFVQDRIGFRGRPFRMLKFRSMVATDGAEASLVHAKTLAGDQRITRVGRIIRRLRIDELPQMVNILRGDMSWIGPRPEARRLSEWYGQEIAFYGFRHIVRPGITGWAQVHQGHVTEITEVQNKLQYDFYYIKYFSWWLDALIILRTIRTLLVGNGAK